MAVKETFEEYLQFKLLAANSVTTYRRAVDYFVELFGDIEAEDVTPRHAARYKVALKTEKGLKKSSPNTYLQAMKTFFGWWAEDSKKDDPFKNVKLYPKEEILRPIYTTEEVKRIYDSLNMDTISGLRDAVVVTLVFSGMRRGELENLTVKEVDYTNGCIKVRAKELTSTTWPWGAKGKCERLVGLSKKGVNLIANLQSVLEQDQPYVVLSPKHYQLMLNRMENEKKGYLPRLTTDSCNNPWQSFSTYYFPKLLKNAGVEHKRPHDGRTYLCMQLLDAQMPLPKVKDALGHKSIQTTAGYYARYLKEETASEVGQILNNIM